MFPGSRFPATKEVNEALEVNSFKNGGALSFNQQSKYIFVFLVPDSKM